MKYQANNANRKAFLTMIAVSEGTQHLGYSGYNVIVGGSLFLSYDDHPRKKVYFPRYKIWSTAAGRYQILERYWDHYKRELKLTDFSPQSQDAVALKLIDECGALGDVDAGRIGVALQKCRSRWASLPGAGYGQHENKAETLIAAYKDAGGVVV